MPRVPPVVAVVYEAIFGVTQRFWAVVDKQVHTGLGNTMVSLRLSIGLRVKKRSRDVLHRPQLQELPQGFCQKARAVVSEQCRSRFHWHGRLSRKF